MQKLLLICFALLHLVPLMARSEPSPWTFPRPHSVRRAVIVASSAGGLASAAHDAVSYGLAFGKQAFVMDFFLDVTEHEAANIHKQMADHHIIANYHDDLHDIARILSCSTNTFCFSDFLVVISSHGYSVGSTSAFIVFRGQQWQTQQINSLFANVKHQANARTLVVVDTCHSEFMSGFEHASETLPDSATIVSLSATASAESDADDISEPYGFGGGLSAALFDFMAQFPTFANGGFDVNELYRNCSTRLALSGSHPRLRWTT